MRSIEPLLDARGLTVEFRRGRRLPPLRAVDDVNLSILPRETVGLVGESGAGKSTIGRALLGLVSPKRGSIVFDGRDITRLSYRERRRLSRDLQVVFQDPYSSLNPTRTIGQTLRESLRLQPELSPTEVRNRVGEMLERVGLPTNAADRYPVSFSGGQRQRIAIARALMARPRLVICDEPVSALDVSVQAQVLNLLRELQDDFALSYLFISHDLGVVRHFSHRIMVLNRGQVMEAGDAAAIYSRPRHPYTASLLRAVPIPDPAAQRARREQRVTTAAAGRGGNGQGTEQGCPFSDRCPHSADDCASLRPELERDSAGTTIACHRWREIAR